MANYQIKIVPRADPVSQQDMERITVAKKKSVSHKRDIGRILSIIAETENDKVLSKYVERALQHKHSTWEEYLIIIKAVHTRRKELWKENNLTKS
jgi:hypothetical protein